MDMTDTIIPKSDQLNAEDLLSGPRTVTVKEVRKSASADQPVDIVLVEFPEGRPFKPSKTVRRILVAAWGVETSTYIGRRMTIYCDPTVKWGGQDVGGIRISALSHIDKPLKLALTVTRGKRAPHIVQPLAEPVDSGPSQKITEAVKHFQEAWSVNVGLLEARVGRATDAWTPQDVASLRTLSGELKRGTKHVADEFPKDAATESAPTGDGEPSDEDIAALNAEAAAAEAERNAAPSGLFGGAE